MSGEFENWSDIPNASWASSTAILQARTPSIGQLLKEIEQQCVDWRWRLKDRVHRLRQVHGDFHPWNILFREGTDFVLLDRSRGEWGEPADDVTCLTMNYLFFSLQRSGRLDGNFESLFRRFWDRYLAKSGDIGDAPGRCALLCVPRPRDGASRLVSEPDGRMCVRSSSTLSRPS